MNNDHDQEANFFRNYYHKCCGQRHPLNLEMVNNNHEVSLILMRMLNHEVNMRTILLMEMVKNNHEVSLMT